jgi:uncharacterized protein DUF6491
MSKLKSGFRVALGVALMALARFASAETSVPAEQSIPFANHGGIRDWAADGDHGLWIQDLHRHWYYAKLMAPCLGLDFAQTIGFDTHPQDRFDHFSSIVVPGNGRCAVASLRASGMPPSKRSKAKS